MIIDTIIDRTQMCKTFVKNTLQLYTTTLSEEDYNTICSTLLTIVLRIDNITECFEYNISSVAFSNKMKTLTSYILDYHKDNNVKKLIYKLLIQDNRYTCLYYTEIMNLIYIRLFLFLYKNIHNDNSNKQITFTQYTDLKIILYREIILCKDTYETNIKSCKNSTVVIIKVLVDSMIHIILDDINILILKYKFKIQISWMLLLKQYCQLNNLKNKNHFSFCDKFTSLRLL